MCVTQEREVQAGGEKGFFVCLFFVQSLAGAMVARLPTEQEAVGSSPTSGLWNGERGNRVCSALSLVSSFPCRHGRLFFVWRGFFLFLLVSRKLLPLAFLCKHAVDQPTGRKIETYHRYHFFFGIAM